MKSLLLLRHAKSSWGDAALADFDRSLAPRGEAAARRVGEEMLARGWVPERALVSTARRTRETWGLVSAQWPDSVEITFVGALYDATAATLLGEIRGTPERVATLLMIGHNPGTETLASQLAGEGSDEAALGQLMAKFPTSGLARFELDGAWADLARGSARLTDFVRPRELG